MQFERIARIVEKLSKRLSRHRSKADYVVCLNGIPLTLYSIIRTEILWCQSVYLLTEKQSVWELRLWSERNINDAESARIVQYYTDWSRYSQYQEMRNNFFRLQLSISYLQFPCFKGINDLFFFPLFHFCNFYFAQIDRRIRELSLDIGNLCFITSHSRFSVASEILYEDLRTIRCRKYK